MKNYPGLTFDYVLYEMSYMNAMKYSAVLPGYLPKDKKHNKSNKGGKSVKVHGLQSLINTMNTI